MLNRSFDDSIFQKRSSKMQKIRDNFQVRMHKNSLDLTKDVNYFESHFNNISIFVKNNELKVITHF